MGEIVIKKLELLEMELSFNSNSANIHTNAQIRTIIIGILKLGDRIDKEITTSLIRDIEKRTNRRIL